LIGTPHVVKRASRSLIGTFVGQICAIVALEHAIDGMFSLFLASMFARLADAMARRERRNVGLILLESQRALHMSQREFGYAVGASHRSAVRWAARQATPGESHLRKLAGLLLPHNRALAAEVADYIDESLVSLGLEAPAPPQPSPRPPGPQLRAEDLVDLLVLAAVERTGAAPAATRTMLHAVFKRAREVGLTVEVAEGALQARMGEATAV
jgi:hypothetical protein